MAEFIIHDSNYQDHLEPPPGCSKGCLPRDYQAKPVGYCASAPAFSLPLIPESEWQSRLDAMIAAKSQLSDIRNKGLNGSPIPSRDQNGKGYCWMHSGTSAAILCRAKDNQPYADLSAYAGACIIKNYRDQGGNGIDGVEFIAERGLPTAQYWPQQSMSRANDNPTTWENAALHKYQQWMDLDPSNMKAQLVTCLLLRIPLAVDFDWWSHSVCGMDLVSLSPFSIRIWNSWGDGWSQNGTGILQGNKAMPDAAVACLTMTAAIA